MFGTFVIKGWESGGAVRSWKDSAFLLASLWVFACLASQELINEIVSQVPSFFHTYPRYLSLVGNLRLRNHHQRHL